MRKHWHAIIAATMLLGAAAPAGAQQLTASDAQASRFNGMWAVVPATPEGGFSPHDGRGFGAEGRPFFGGVGLGPPKTAFSIVTHEDAVKGLDEGDVLTREMMTPAGKAKFATFNPLDHPTSQCQSPGLPAIVLAPELQRWKVSTDSVSIRHESETEARIGRFGEPHPKGAPTLRGHATAKLDGDTLVIETANLAEAWGGLGRNAPGSDARIIRETYRLTDRNTMQGLIEIEDAKFLTEPLRLPIRLERQLAGIEIVDFPCDIEAAQRDFKYIQNGAAKSNATAPGPAPLARHE